MKAAAAQAGASAVKDEKVTTVSSPPSSPTGKLSPEQNLRLDVLLPAATAAIQQIEDRMTALAIAATVRWVPEQSAYSTDEDASPVFGDQEYADFIATLENIADVAMFRAVAEFMLLPTSVVDTVIAESLSLRVNSRSGASRRPRPSENPSTFVSYKRKPERG